MKNVADPLEVNMIKHSINQKAEAWMSCSLASKGYPNCGVGIKSFITMTIGHGVEVVSIY